MISHSDNRVSTPGSYGTLVSSIGILLEQSRRHAVRAVNSVLTATYWEIGQRIVEFEQGGEARAEYGEKLISRLAADLTSKFGRGFSKRNVEQMRAFYLGWEIAQTASAQLKARVKCQTSSGESSEAIVQTQSGQSQTPPTLPAEWSASLLSAFPLSWSHYVHLISVENLKARIFYEAEAVKGGWSVRQLDRQIGTQFFERTLASDDPQALIVSAGRMKPEDVVPVESAIRDPYLLEFLNLRDEYSESDLEDALIRHLECFLLELGNGFTFVARQKRIRIGNVWYRIDLLLFHRGLRCLVIVDLKTGVFSHADAGQMNLYLNYVREHLTMPGESEPVGTILCSDKDDAVVKYATGGINARVFASKYLSSLPDEDALRQEILKAQRAVQARLQEGRHNG